MDSSALGRFTDYVALWIWHLIYLSALSMRSLAPLSAWSIAGLAHSLARSFAFCASDRRLPPGDEALVSSMCRAKLLEHAECSASSSHASGSSPKLCWTCVLDCVPMFQTALLLTSGACLHGTFADYEYL